MTPAAATLAIAANSRKVRGYVRAARQYAKVNARYQKRHDRLKAALAKLARRRDKVLVEVCCRRDALTPTQLAAANRELGGDVFVRVEERSA